MDDFPNELIRMIVDCLETNQLPAWRLVSRRLSREAQQRFRADNFERLKAEMTPLGLLRLSDITAHSFFGATVREVTFSAIADAASLNTLDCRAPLTTAFKNIYAHSDRSPITIGVFVPITAPLHEPIHNTSNVLAYAHHAARLNGLSINKFTIELHDHPARMETLYDPNLISQFERLLEFGYDCSVAYVVRTQEEQKMRLGGLTWTDGNKRLEVQRLNRRAVSTHIHQHCADGHLESLVDYICMQRDTETLVFTHGVECLQHFTWPMLVYPTLRSLELRNINFHVLGHGFDDFDPQRGLVLRAVLFEKLKHVGLERLVLANVGWFHSREDAENMESSLAVGDVVLEGVDGVAEGIENWIKVIEDSSRQLQGLSSSVAGNLEG